jgi:hypothetical protein
MKRKRNLNVVTTERLINAEEVRINKTPVTNSSNSTPEKLTTNNNIFNTKNILTIQTTPPNQIKATPIQPARSILNSLTQPSSLKPTFQSNFINNQPLPQKNTNSNPIATTTTNTQLNTKMVHNSIGSPIVLTTTIPSITTTTTKTQISESDFIPEWKRSLLEKKKMKKTF